MIVTDLPTTLTSKRNGDLIELMMGYGKLHSPFLLRKRVEYSIHLGKISMEIDYEKLDREARPGAFSTLDAEVLVPEVMKLKAGDIYLEIGVDKGKSLSIAKMVAKDGVRIIGVDLKENTNIQDTIFLQGDSVKIANQYYMAGKISV